MTVLSLFLSTLLFLTPMKVSTSFQNTKTLKLDGSSKYVDFGDNYGCSTGACSFSVAGWIYSTSTASYQGIFDKQRPAGAFQGYTLLLTDQDFRFQFGSTAPNLLDVNTTGNPITHNAWHFFCLTYDGSRVPGGVVIYVDSNTPQAMHTNTNTLGTQSTVTTQALRIGYAQANASYFAGNINQFSFYSSRVLNSTEVNALYNSGHPKSLTGTTGLSSWWELNQLDSSTTINDQAGAITGTGTNLVSGDYVSATPSPP